MLRAAAILWLFAATSGMPLAAPDSAPARTPSSRDVILGQWVWSDADLRRMDEARRHLGAIRPGLWVATIAVERGAIVQRLARDPKGAPPDAAFVVRFDDSFHQAWVLDDAAVARAVDARLSALLGHVAAAGLSPIEVQLDYDCPVRLLPRWASVVRALSRGALRGCEVWITSLGVHVLREDYGDLFRGAIAGHVLQLFDVGDVSGPRDAASLSRAAAARGIPFRVGLGGFERQRPDGSLTRHASWFAQLDAFRSAREFRGVWVFPAGRRWWPLIGGAR